MMPSLLIDRETVKQMCAFYDDLSNHGCLPASDASIVLHFKQVIGLKYQRVTLAPGLTGVISSDDGKQLKVLYRDAVVWLNA